MAAAAVRWSRISSMLRDFWLIAGRPSRAAADEGNRPSVLS